MSEDTAYNNHLENEVSELRAALAEKEKGGEREAEELRVNIEAEWAARVWELNERVDRWKEADARSVSALQEQAERAESAEKEAQGLREELTQSLQDSLGEKLRADEFEKMVAALGHSNDGKWVRTSLLEAAEREAHKLREDLVSANAAQNRAERDNKALREELKQAKAGVPTLARKQDCGCIVCLCDGDQCLGCGSKNCGKHPVSDIPNPKFNSHPLESKIAAQAQEIKTLKESIQEHMSECPLGCPETEGPNP